MRHPTMDDHWVGELLAVFVPESLRRRGREQEAHGADHEIERQTSDSAPRPGSG